MLQKYLCYVFLLFVYCVAIHSCVCVHAICVHACVCAVHVFGSYLAVYERIRQRLEHSGRSSVVSVMIAGSVGRTVAVVVSSPFEYIRTVMQAHHPTQGVNMIRDAIAMRGMGTLWLGLVPTLLRDVPFSIIYWGGYEYGARTLQPWFASRPLHDSSLVHVPSMARNFVAGAASGMVAAAFTTPFDVVKTRRQVASQTTASTHDLRLTAIIKQIFRDEGVAGFMHGLIPRVIRVTPACAIMITSYELFKTHFMRHNNGHRD
eukprot:c12443_g1_i4.p1 GENE.c12443_g1_i4~~c12443_g1_i4.p1  ORF type:complete len:261 (-),score=40.70 c12443_g1_i4:54-836(-)